MADIDVAFVKQWDTQIRLQAQQATSRIFGTLLDRGTITGESFTANYLAPLDDTPENNDRHGDTVWSQPDHSTRLCPMKDFYQALPVDRADEPKVLANPSGSYMDSLTQAWARRQDRQAFQALLGNSFDKDGATIALPSSQKILHGSAGMTKAKLIQAKKLFRSNECDEHNGLKLYMAYTAEMMEDILSDTTLTSADFMAVKMLQEGDISGKWLGFNWVPYERINVNGSTYSTAAWTDRAAHRGTGFVEGKSQRRGDKKDTMQVSMAGSIGVIRVEEKHVVEVQYQ